MDDVMIVQICSAGNTLFGLDKDGIVYCYDWTEKKWIALPMTKG